MLDLENLDFDGIVFLPHEDEENFSIEYRFIKCHADLGECIEGTQIGEKYHVFFFKENDSGDFVEDSNFEAIFSDPVTYIKNLTGSNLYGTMIKKREKSKIWFEEYSKSLIANFNIQFGESK